MIKPNWPAPKNIKAFTTTRTGGVSEGSFASFNLADHSGDNSASVQKNRVLLREQLQLPAEPAWIKQVHGVECVAADSVHGEIIADACYTFKPGIVCTVLTADCLPILICDKNASRVAAIHAGWRGLATGIIEQTFQTLKIAADELLVWFGPAIGPTVFEVGGEVREAFLQFDPNASSAFKVHNDRWLADIYLLARQRLNHLGITAVYGGDLCTFSDAQRFYSYRRDKETGRMASLIWIDA